MKHDEGIIIAIDGPAGSGKSSTAREVARRLGYRHLDSGAFYRGLTLAAIRAGIPAERWEALNSDEISALGVGADPDDDGYRISIHGENVSDEIRSPEVNALVSRMAALPAVRAWLLDALRRAGDVGRLVADGRDIGTVVFPDAELKVFLVCAPEERARRRLLEQGHTRPDNEQIALEQARLARRDSDDSSRAVAPLMRAEDAVQLDTTDLSFDDQVAAIIAMAKQRS
ncbi:MAG TPA: (d)CMP kinase [Longimicrobiaceae bacterium]|nr:(d)CMP kinase [Longimicrobiaceae bacterium]